jgi:hypothetical protein
MGRCGAELGDGLFRGRTRFPLRLRFRFADVAGSSELLPASVGNSFADRARHERPPPAAFVARAPKSLPSSILRGAHSLLSPQPALSGSARLV